jgi:hypothetical protein
VTDSVSDAATEEEDDGDGEVVTVGDRDGDALTDVDCVGDALKVGEIDDVGLNEGVTEKDAHIIEVTVTEPSALCSAKSLQVTPNASFT